MAKTISQIRIGLIAFGFGVGIRRLCLNIIAAQKEEISFMKNWLDRKGQKK